jgi:hypothetical protein
MPPERQCRVSMQVSQSEHHARDEVEFGEQERRDEEDAETREEVMNQCEENGTIADVEEHGTGEILETLVQLQTDPTEITSAWGSNDE